MATKLYLTGDSTVSAGVPTAERSAAMTAAVETPRALDLAELPAGLATPLLTDVTTPPVIGPVWGYHGKWVTHTLDGLVGSTLPAGTYSYAFGVQEADALADAFVALSIYVRASDDTIRGIVYDNAAGLGTEYALSTTSIRGRQGSVAGAAVAGIAAGDQLVVEVWSRVNQTDGVSRKIRFYWAGTTDPVEGVGATSPASYVLVPADGMFAAVTSGAYDGLVTPTGDLAIGSTGAIAASGPVTPTGDLAIAQTSNLAPTAGGTAPSGELTLGRLSSNEDCAVSGILPWAAFCGGELANMARAYEYVQRFRPRGVQMLVAPPPILYRTTGTPVVYSSPASDPAPWFNNSQPASAEFLGGVLLPIVDSPLSRSVTPRQRGGASIGPQVVGPRTITFDGWLYALSDRGREYGISWLVNTLMGCEDCGSCDLELYYVAPPGVGESDSEGHWTFHEVALTSGVDVVEQSGNSVHVQFTLTAGRGERFADATPILSMQPIPISTSGSDCIPWDQWFCTEGPNDDRLFAVVPPTLIGDVGLVWTVDAAGGSSSGLVLEIREDCTDEVPLATLTLGTIPAGSYVVVDGGQGIITYIDPQGVVQDGSFLVALADDETIAWPAIKRCVPGRCVAIGRTRLCAGGAGVMTGLQAVERRI